MAGELEFMFICPGPYCNGTKRNLNVGNLVWENESDPTIICNDCLVDIMASRSGRAGVDA